MSAEYTILNLFDSNWFQSENFSKRNPSPLPNTRKAGHEDQKKSKRMCLISKKSKDASPNNTDSRPQLQTILSRKKIESFHDLTGGTIRKKRREAKSKSMSELELEELKGFMDLRFAFSDPRLVSISKPYLSEAWDYTLGVKINRLTELMRMTAFANESEVKRRLREWAHTVASTAR